MSFEVKCVVGEDHFCIEVPIDSSVGEVLKKASGHSGMKGVSLWYSDIPLNCDHQFADYFEPDVIYHVRVGGNYPNGVLLNSNEAKLSVLGVNLTAPKLLMQVGELEWSMDEFWQKTDDYAPTLVLMRMKNGTECGGVATVPWPKKGMLAGVPAKGSFIFSLGALPARFDLVKSETALVCGFLWFAFGRAPSDLFIRSDSRDCGSYGQGDYAGPREKGQLVGGTAETWLQPYERWELWRL
jgi:hypothetical protein